MFKQDKSNYTFSKRYFALYEGGLLAYYTHQRDFEEDVKKHKGLVSANSQQSLYYGGISTISTCIIYYKVSMHYCLYNVAFELQTGQVEWRLSH